MQVVHYVLTLDVGPFLVGLELSSLSPEFFPGLIFTEFRSLAFDTLGLLGVALHLILNLSLCKWPFGAPLSSCQDLLV